MKEEEEKALGLLVVLSSLTVLTVSIISGTVVEGLEYSDKS